MNALTICQPYAHLIALPDTDPLKKRVENRTWHAPPDAIGKLIVIHAGKSRDWLTVEDEARYPNMPFGAAIAVARLADCIEFRGGRLESKWEKKYPWLREHLHAQGPFCWVLTEVRKLPQPIPYRGAQGLWRFPDELMPEDFRP